ncbi:MAG TPA: hypothetical protein PKG71_03075 [Candidatus Woesebacteria bacterium]|jgi:hypothetical protein|nr:hypothetical protein [Candidatus Woesebacteria bacterium]HNS94925.1 hypothetical protein [Candidatus Woesebacteria bacterium]
MSASEQQPKKHDYLYRVLRGQAFLDPIRLIGCIAEKVRKNVRRGTVFKNKH